jgi:predicted transcriptional regulator
MENSKKNLTKAELNVMNILWDKGQATVSEIIGEMSEPKPAYTTVLTVMQVLTRKEVVQPERQGKAHVFRPLLSREEYIDGFLNETRDTVFKGSVRSFFSYFVKKERLSKEEVQQLLDEINREV